MVARISGLPVTGDTVRVWDPVVRVFHWGTVILFVSAYLIEHPRDLHKALGYTVIGLLAIRVIWGFVGTRHARFTDFVPSPRGFFTYCRSLLDGTETRHIGHNPAGGAMVVALMIMLAAIGLSGWLMGLDQFFGQEWVEELHEGAVSFTLLLVALHLGGVLYESLRHRENLVKSMLTGKKRV